MNIGKDLITGLLLRTAGGRVRSIAIDRPEIAHVRDGNRSTFDHSFPPPGHWLRGRYHDPDTAKGELWPRGCRPRCEPAMIVLPPIDVYRWTMRRKAAVVAAVEAGEISREEICRRYQISPEEFLSWQRAYDAFGLPGLRSTRLQQYRRAAPPPRRGRPNR